MAAPARRDVRFPSRGADCSAWHYAGRNGACVVLAGGLAVPKGPGTEKFAERFNAAGFHVLAFDYRGLGESGGEPRQLVRGRDQLEDWDAAIAFARGLPDVDPGRIAIWGHSFSGGHVLTLAARRPDLGAAIAQAPNVDGLRAFAYHALRTDPRSGVRLAAATLADLLGAALGRGPRLIPLAAPRGGLATLTSPDACRGVPTLNPDGRYEWRTEVAARAAFAPVPQRPLREAHRIRCPLLVVACEDDGVTPPGPAYAAASRAPRGELLKLPGGHYAPYAPETFDRAVDGQIDFLRRHLEQPTASRAEPPPSAVAAAS